VRLSFTHHGRRFQATYLPDVAAEQGWSQEETLVSLMRKAGWTGRSGEWRKVADLKVVRYEGRKASAGFEEWREWREWVDGREGMEAVGV
jgi:AMMECR1 domain-containing protein